MQWHGNKLSSFFGRICGPFTYVTNTDLLSSIYNILIRDSYFLQFLNQSLIFGLHNSIAFYLYS